MKVKIRYSASNPRFARVDGSSIPLCLLHTPTPYSAFRAESISFYATRTRAENACDALGDGASWLLFYLTGGGEWKLFAESFQAERTYPHDVQKMAGMVSLYWRMVFDVRRD